MSTEVNTVAGSGTVANMQPMSPVYSFPEGTFPVPNAKDTLRNRRAESVAVSNPADFSVSIGLRSSQLNVTASAVELTPSPLEYRRAIVIHNDGASVLYLGHSSAVTTADGFPLAAGEKIAIDLTGNPNTAVYGISGGTSDVRIMEFA
jgi:hypothetical protein